MRSMGVIVMHPRERNDSGGGKNAILGRETRPTGVAMCSRGRNNTHKGGKHAVLREENQHHEGAMMHSRCSHDINIMVDLYAG